MNAKSFRSIRIVLIGTTLLLLGCLPAWARGAKEDWPCWRGPNGDGVSQETDWDPEALEGGARILWTANVGRGYSNIAIKDDLLVTMGIVDQQDHVFCLNAATGAEYWRYSFESLSFFGPQSTPAIDGNRIYALATYGTLLCLDVKDGTLLWEKHLVQDYDAREPKYGFSASPVIDGKVLLVNADSKMIELDKTTGDLLWGVDVEVPKRASGSYSTPVVAEVNGRRCALFLDAVAFQAVEVATGNVLWEYEHGDRPEVTADPIVHQSEIFLSLAETSVLLETDEMVADELWNAAVLTSGMMTPVLVQGYLYGTHWPPNTNVLDYDWNTMFRLDWPFRCISWETGEVMWEKTMKSASIMAAGDMLIVLELDGTLHIVEANPSSFHERSSADVLAGKKTRRIFATPPVLLDGRIYCRNYTGELVCIDVSE
jgi:outer membrane protein assembly factor BamB